MNFDCFSHGQILSKMWLCDNIEIFLNNSNIAILGGWYNILGFMLLTKYNDKIKSIDSFDIDEKTKPIADKITDAWSYKVTNSVADVNEVNLDKYDIVINCSPEHMEKVDWFKNIKSHTIVILQSSNMIEETDPWLIKNPNSSIDIFSEKFILSEVNYLDTLDIDYEYWGYKRFMLIGKK